MKFKILFVFLFIGVLSQYILCQNTTKLSKLDFILPEITTNSNCNLQDYIGKKVIVLNFFATWCAVCKDEIPKLISLKNLYKDNNNIVFIGVTNGDFSKEKDVNKVKSFISKYDYPFLVCLDLNNEVSVKQYKIFGVPCNLIINKDGSIIYQDKNPPTRQIIDSFL